MTTKINPLFLGSLAFLTRILNSSWWRKATICSLSKGLNNIQLLQISTDLTFRPLTISLWKRIKSQRFQIHHTFKRFTPQLQGSWWRKMFSKMIREILQTGDLDLKIKTKLLIPDPGLDLNKTSSSLTLLRKLKTSSSLVRLTKNRSKDPHITKAWGKCLKVTETITSISSLHTLNP